MLAAMFEAVEGGERIDKATYEKRVAKLRAALLDLQYRVLSAKKFPVVVVIGGVEGAGKGETVNLLNEWMDPRHIQSHAVGAPTDEEAMRPPMWRFWRRLPPRGKIGIFFGSWYTMPIVRHVNGEASRKDLDLAMAEIRHFETMLAKEGALVVKYWFHIAKQEMKDRLEELEADKHSRWRVTKEDWKRFAKYDDYRRVSERALTETWTNDAPWTLVDGSDPRGRVLFVGESLLSAMSDHLEKHTAEKPAEVPDEPSATAATPAEPPRKKAARPNGKPKKPAPSVLANLDLTQRLAKKDYEKALAKWQRELALLTRHKRFGKLSPVVVFEGADAAGKGGAIRRVTQALDARLYDVHPVAAPTDEERAQPYLWRFWRHAPRDGKFCIFDRSWYGRVLVERVEGFCAPADWKRAYDEILDFEAQLVRAGCPIAKFWLQISPEEQLRRFKERQDIAWKQFKITDEDWRNREKWSAYQVAASEMIERTSADFARWTVVSAEDKYHARIHILKTLCETLEGAL
jgi:polyphosphate:AMP phosphotransferase